MHRARYPASLALIAAACAAFFLVASPAGVLADDTDKKADTKAAKKASASKEKPHLDYKRTYGEALLEARIRNLPVFVSRHKDF